MIEKYDIGVKYNHQSGLKNGVFELFDNAEWTTSGDFVIICEELIKTVIPLIQIDYIKLMKHPNKKKI